MPRTLDATTATHVGDQALTVAFFLRLDIVGDPVIAWTGWGSKAISGTGDGAMDGQTFDGITHLIGEIDAINDSVGGSQALEVTLPGVDLNDEALRQVVRDKRKWQFRQAWLWMAFLDASMNIIGKPIRLKTGRMDQMIVTEDEQGGATCKVVIEGQQAYAAEALNTRYVETKDLDASDTSNDYVWSLANMNPVIGQTGVGSSNTGGGGGQGISGGDISGGGPGSGRFLPMPNDA